MDERRGLLFSDDEQETEIDVSKTNVLIAAAKITLFEVETVLLAYPFSEICVDERGPTGELCFCLKETETPKGESLSVAQMKAQRIEETFENPFRMVGDTIFLTL